MLKARTFSIDNSEDTQEFKGYHDPKENWNGWAIPYFTKEVAEQVLKACVNEQESWKFKANCFIISAEDEDIPDSVYTSIDIETEHGLKRLWSIGGMEWTWGLIVE